jgi:hypothetical protein
MEGVCSDAWTWSAVAAEANEGSEPSVFRVADAGDAVGFCISSRLAR